MLAIVWLGTGHMRMVGMGRMEKGAVHAAKSERTKLQTKAITTPLTMPEESTEPQN